MTETIEIEVGALHGELHERLDGMLGEQYRERLRNQNEEFVHELYRQVERMQEQQDSIEQKMEEVEEVED